MIFDAVNEGEVKLTINLVPNNHGLTKKDVVWAYPLVLYNTHLGSKSDSLKLKPTLTVVAHI